jgi:glycosyltransferase involved in cell wall biosynthesis
MNIIILEDSSKAGFGGGQRITLDMIKALKDSYKIFVFDTSNKSLFTEKLKDLQIDVIKLESYSKVSKSLFIKFLEKIISFWMVIKNMILINKFLVKYKIKHNILVYATSKKGLVLAFMINKFLNIDFIYHAHMIDNAIVNKIVEYLTQKAYKTLCVSPLVAQQYSNQNIEVISNSIDILNIKHKTIMNKHNFVVATISSLNYIKGIEYFVGSYEYLKNQDIEYHIYGEGPLKRLLEQNSNDNLKFKNYISDVKEVLLNEIDILVVPTIIPESFGMVILEAFSCGIPVISTNIGMQKTLVNDSQAGELVNIKSSKDIAVKIDDLLSNKEKYQIYSKNALKYVKKFDKANFNSKIQKVFKDYDITS